MSDIVATASTIAFHTAGAVIDIALLVSDVVYQGTSTLYRYSTEGVELTGWQKTEVFASKLPQIERLEIKSSAILCQFLVFTNIPKRIIKIMYFQVVETFNCL
jgi:hypothetical protein